MQIRYLFLRLWRRGWSHLPSLAIADEAPTVAFNVLRAPVAAQRRKPMIAVGAALVAAGSVARLRAASADPFR